VKDKLSLIFEDENLIAVNKPSGLLTIPDRKGDHSLKDILLNRFGDVFTVHRLDRDTSGIVLFAKNPETHRHLSLLFENRQISKCYVGIASGLPSPPSGIIEAPIKEHPQHKGTMMVHKLGKPSKTSYEVIDPDLRFSLIRFQLFTGRTHQIRVHAHYIGHPIACDPIYGDGKPVYLSMLKKKFKFSKTEEERPVLNRLALHAQSLQFIDLNGKSLLIETAVPKEFLALMKQLHKLN